MENTAAGPGRCSKTSRGASLRRVMLAVALQTVLASVLCAQDQSDLSGADTTVIEAAPERLSRASGLAEIILEQRGALGDEPMRLLMSVSPEDRVGLASHQAGPGTVRVSGRVDSVDRTLSPTVVFFRVVPADDESGTGTTLSVETRRDGSFEAVVPIAGARSMPAAGYTFHVEASLDASFSCGDRCDRTGAFRLWKRVYLERDAMYRSGTTVVGAATVGEMKVAVDDVTPFRRARRDRPVDVMVMRAPRGGGERPPVEPGRVVGIERPHRRSTAGYVLLAEPIAEILRVDDAIVVPAEGVFEPPSIETAKEVFARAFVELVELPNRNRHVPHRLFRVEKLGDDFNSFAQRWSDHGGDTSTAHNLVMLVSADYKTQTLPNGAATMYAAVGSCNVKPTRVNNVFLWHGAVEQQVRQNPKGTGIGGMKASDVLPELVVHEMAHLFGLEDCDGCDRVMNADGTGLSTMSMPVGPEMGDGIAGFHASEYLQISTSVDPLPQALPEAPVSLLARSRELGEIR